MLGSVKCVDEKKEKKMGEKSEPSLGGFNLPGFVSSHASYNSLPTGLLGRELVSG